MEMQKKKNMEEPAGNADVWENTGLETLVSSVCTEYVKVKH